MRVFLQRNSFSPHVQADMAMLGLVKPRRSLGPTLIMFLALVDIAAAVFSLLSP